MATKTIFVPFGELKPDWKLFNNDGLVNAVNVAPVHGNYVAAQRWLADFTTPAFTSAATGFPRDVMTTRAPPATARSAVPILACNSRTP